MQEAVAKERSQQEQALREATAQKKEARGEQQRRPIGVGAAQGDAHAGNAEDNTADKGGQGDAAQGDAHAGNAEDNTADKGGQGDAGAIAGYAQDDADAE